MEILLTDADRFPMSEANRAKADGAGATVTEVEGHDPADVAARGSKAQGLLVYHAHVDADVLHALPRLQIVARCGSGYDNIDVHAARARGIVVTFVPGYGSVDVAEHALALLVASTKRIVAGHQALLAGRWPSARELGSMYRIRGRTLGLVGFGRIAREVATRAKGLGLRVAAFDPYVGDAQMTELEAEPKSLEQLLAVSDFVSIHLPLTADTRHLFDAAAFAAMKPGSILVNTSRGAIVDESALVAALDGGHLAGAALDVFESEPPPPTHPLLERGDVIATPHSAAFTDEALDEVQARALDDVLGVLAGAPPQNPVPEEK